MLALYIILFWIILGLIGWMLFYFRITARLTSFTTGQVIATHEREIRDDRGRRDETTVVCRFRTQNRDFEVSHVFRGRIASYYPNGRSVPVRYNPADPNMARIAVRG